MSAVHVWSHAPSQRSFARAAARPRREPSVVIEVTSAPDFNRLIGRIAAAADREAFAELFRHFAPRVKSYALRLGAPPAAAEELAQETLLSVWRKADRFDPARAGDARGAGRRFAGCGRW